jgi:hypothetical protein
VRIALAVFKGNEKQYYKKAAPESGAASELIS